MSKKVICFGEILWDVFPGGEKIGGAPLNVALRLKSLGIATTIVSKIGKDQLGKRLIDFIHQQGIGTEYIQQDAQFETGKVNVSLDQKGSATYEITIQLPGIKSLYNLLLKKRSLRLIYFSLGVW